MCRRFTAFYPAEFCKSQIVKLVLLLIWDCSPGDIVQSQFLIFNHVLLWISQYWVSIFLLTKRKQHFCIKLWNIFLNNESVYASVTWILKRMWRMRVRVEILSLNICLMDWCEIFLSIQIWCCYGPSFSESGLRTRWSGSGLSTSGKVFPNIGDSTRWSRVPSEEFNEAARQLSCGVNVFAL